MMSGGLILSIDLLRTVYQLETINVKRKFITTRHTPGTLDAYQMETANLGNATNTINLALRDESREKRHGILPVEPISICQADRSVDDAPHLVADLEGSCDDGLFVELVHNVTDLDC